MNKYIIMFTDTMKLMDEYKVIEGKDAKGALKKAFGCSFRRLYGNDGRRADVIMVKGDFKNNTIFPSGRYQELCYEVIR